jgi:hypothetical protein
MENEKVNVNELEVVELELDDSVEALVHRC